MLKKTVHTLLISSLLVAGATGVAATGTLERKTTKESKSEMTPMDAKMVQDIHDLAAGVKGAKLTSDKEEAARNFAAGVSEFKPMAISDEFTKVPVLAEVAKDFFGHDILAHITLTKEKIPYVASLFKDMTVTSKNVKMAKKYVDLISFLPIEQVKELNINHIHDFAKKYDGDAEQGLEEGIQFLKIIAMKNVAERTTSGKLSEVLNDGLTLMFFVLAKGEITYAEARDKALADGMCFL
jgi:hypothetical protein